LFTTEIAEVTEIFYHLDFSVFSACSAVNAYLTYQEVAKRGF